MVQSVPQKGMTLKEEEGQVSFIYTKKEPRPAFCYNIERSNKDQPVRYITVVSPYTGKQPKVNIRLLKNPPVGATHISLEVDFNGKKRTINYDIKN